MGVTAGRPLAGLGAERPADTQEGRPDAAPGGGPLPAVVPDPCALCPGGADPAAEDEPAAFLCPGAEPDFPGAPPECPGAVPECPGAAPEGLGADAFPVEWSDLDPAHAGPPCPARVEVVPATAEAAPLTDVELP
jgi:hypothetical protein